MQNYEKNQHEHKIWLERLKSAITSIHLYDCLDVALHLWRAVSVYLAHPETDNSQGAHAPFSQLFDLIEAVEKLNFWRGYNAEIETKQEKIHQQFFEELFTPK